MRLEQQKDIEDKGIAVKLAQDNHQQMEGSKTKDLVQDVQMTSSSKNLFQYM